jgi:hypothetical protein
MAQFTLQPYKLRDWKFVPTKEAPLVLDWPQYRAKLAPTGSRRALLNLRMSRAGHFVGLIRDKNSQQIHNFIMINTGNQYQTKLILKKDETIADRLIEVYRVEGVVWDDSCEEFPEGTV